MICVRSSLRLAFLLGVPVLIASTPHAGAAIDFNSTIRPMLQEHCLKCHSTEKQKGDLDMEQALSESALRKFPKIWQGVLEQVSTREMPPKEKPQPTEEQRAQLLQWTQETLESLGRENAGDPGPVVLRRLSNAEYTYTIRDLTGLPELDPAKEFPVDGAAGEGFSNTGQALVMSPTLLTKYLDAAKEITSHAVFLPDGLRFSSSTTRRDWTEEILAEIRKFYGQFTAEGGSETVTQQGIALDKNKGGALPLGGYFTASLQVRDGIKSVEAAAKDRGLIAKYLHSLVDLMQSDKPSPLLDGIRKRWKTASEAEVPSLVAEIEAWQKTLWKFSSVGHIGKVGGPKAWMEPVTPLVNQQEIKLKLDAPPAGGDLVFYLAAGDAGDGNNGDFVLWQQPKLSIPGRPAVLLRDARNFISTITERRKTYFQATARVLAAAQEAAAAKGEVDQAALATKHGVDAESLQKWFSFLGIGPGGEIKLDHLTTPHEKSGEYDFVKGWSTGDLPNLMANSSDQMVKIPGDMKGHGVVVHPTPQLAVAVGWQSPVRTSLRVEGVVTDAHTSCGNGVTWAVELRHGSTRRRLAEGVTDGGKPSPFGPVQNVSVQPGDLISLIIGPRDGDHTCDLTDLELKLTSDGDKPQEWSLTGDVSSNILAGNPHADKAGHEGVWHFYSEPVSGAPTGSVIPADSVLARWKAAPEDGKKQLAEAVQQLLTSPAPPSGTPDAALFAQLTSITGPLFSGLAAGPAPAENLVPSKWGIDPKVFGSHPNGSKIDDASLCVQAPAVMEVRLPADIFAGAELTTTGALDAATGGDGSVQLQISTTKPSTAPSLKPSDAKLSKADGAWTTSNSTVTFGTPIVTRDDSAARKRLEAGFDEFRQMFPAALCYTKIVPVDEVVTLTLFHREDEPLMRLMLDDAQKAQLDRLWREQRFISQDALTLVDAFEQIWQYSSQDGPNAPNGDERLKPLGVTIKDNAAKFKQMLLDTEPRHLEAVLEFANRAFRRPLRDRETADLRGLYAKFRTEELPHEAAIRLLLARVLVAPAFLYRSEAPRPGSEQTPLTDHELASRLSYFLWSSQPDAELRNLANQGKLRDPGVLAAQTTRMLKDAKVRRLSTEFACSWLHVHGFDSLDEKSERHFPTFNQLRAAMYEETILFFTDFFQTNRSLWNILDSDYTFLNEALANHYGIPGVSGEQWRRVDGLKAHGRGGILGQATTLAKQSGASRTSPILRGNWIAEALLGDKLPRPPKDVPRLPEEETSETLTVRQLTEKHSSDERCAHCHVRIDAFGYSLEGFDAIGRSRTVDLANRPIDTKAKVQDGTEIQGLEGLRQYLMTARRDIFLRQFTRKLLGYSLGRSVQLSDEPLLAEIRKELAAHDFQIDTAIQLIVQSRQFQDIRGQDSTIVD